MQQIRGSYLSLAIYNNATPEREELVYRLRAEFGEDNIHIFGSHRTGEVNKFEILSQTMINLCFENSLGEGYVTEKLLHARAMGCKALYWGDDSYKEDFNSDGVLNIRETSSIAEILEWCHHQKKTETLSKIKMQEVQPEIFTKDPTKILNVNRLREWANIVLGWRKQ